MKVTTRLPSSINTTHKSALILVLYFIIKSLNKKTKQNITNKTVTVTRVQYISVVCEMDNIHINQVSVLVHQLLNDMLQIRRNILTTEDITFGLIDNLFKSKQDV